MTTHSSAEIVRQVVDWHFGGSTEREPMPFYCKPECVGSFAVEPRGLAAGDETSIFRLFIALSMYQALRDVVIMQRQRALPRSGMQAVADLGRVGNSITRHTCPALQSTDGFEAQCDVWKQDEFIDCERSPGACCHVKDATTVFRRMGDMGKLPTSAWLRLWRDGGARRVVAEVCRHESSATERAALLVGRYAEVHRVGRKIATLFVSALSVPALAPGLTPWFPEVNGNELVVVDTNVARAADTLREPGAPKTYNARENWVREQAKQIDLQAIRSDLPTYSPRLVQEALYSFGSKSNRIAAGDECSSRSVPCGRCAPAICPFA